MNSRAKYYLQLEGSNVQTFKTADCFKLDGNHVTCNVTETGIKIDQELEKGQGVSNLILLPTFIKIVIMYSILDQVCMIDILRLQGLTCFGY